MDIEKHDTMDMKDPETWLDIDIPNIAKRTLKEENIYWITWGQRYESALTNKLSKGLGVPIESLEECRFAIELVKDKYFPNGYQGQDEWRQYPDGTNSLTCLNVIPNPDTRLQLRIFAREGEKNSELESDWLVDIPRSIKSPEHALALYECLLTYLGYVGIGTWGIRSEVLGTDISEQTKADGRVVELRKNILSWSFKLPYFVGSEHVVIDKLMESRYKNIPKVKSDEEGRKIWVVENITDPDIVINYFNMIANTNTKLVK